MSGEAYPDSVFVVLQWRSSQQNLHGAVKSIVQTILMVCVGIKVVLHTQDGDISCQKIISISVTLDLNCDEAPSTVSLRQCRSWR